MSEQEPLPGAVTLQHGDQVLICVNNDVDSAEDYTWMTDTLKKWFPGVEFCVAANITGVLVQRGEAGNGSEEDE